MNNTQTAGSSVKVPYTPPRLGRRHSFNQLAVRAGLAHLILIAASYGGPKSAEEETQYQKWLDLRHSRDSALAAMRQLADPPKVIYVEPESPPEETSVEAVAPEVEKAGKSQVPQPKQVVVVDKASQKEPRMRKSKKVS